MAHNELHDIARAIVSDGKGILAADESTGTIKKRFDSIGVENTEPNRQAYRDLLFTTPGAEEYISGVILFDETIRQTALDGTPFPKLLESKGVIPGIKVDQGAKPLALADGETITEGLDGLRERLAEYYSLGARFAKWRATYSISDELPSEYCIWTNAHALARYAALCQEAGIVPIVEPEILQDGTHTIERSYHVSCKVLAALYTELSDQRVDIAGTLLKPNMVLSGYEALEPRRCRGSRRVVAQVLLQARACGGARNRLPLRRTVGRGCDRAPQCHECERPAPVEALVLVRPRVAGTRPEGVARQARAGRGCQACVLPPREAERRRDQRPLRAGDGTRDGERLRREKGGAARRPLYERGTSGIRSP